MKTYLKPLFLFSSCALAAISSLNAVETDPVGYVTIDLPDQSDVRFAVQLTGPLAASGSVASVAAGVATVSSAHTVDQYNNSHYILFTSGAQAGQWFQVSDTDINTLTTAEDLAALGVVATDTYNVFPFWTLNTLLPDGGGVPESSDAFAPVALLSTNNVAAVGINLAADKSYVNLTQAAADSLFVGSSAGWHDNANVFAGNVSPYLTPESYVIVRNLSGASSSIVISGAVPVQPLGTQIGRLSAAAQDNLTVNPYPAEVTLDDSGLFESGAFDASTDAFSATDLLLVFEASDTGINSAPSKSYVYLTQAAADSLFIGASAGWFDNSNVFAGNVGATAEIPAGAAIIVRKASGAAGTVSWNPAVPYAGNL